MTGRAKTNPKTGSRVIPMIISIMPASSSNEPNINLDIFWGVHSVFFMMSSFLYNTFKRPDINFHFFNKFKNKNDKKKCK